MQDGMLPGDGELLDALGEQLTRDGARPWYAVISPYRSGVTDNFHLVRLCVEDLPAGTAGFCLFETEADALDWAATKGEQIGMHPAHPPPTTWAVYDGDDPGVYPSEERAAEAAGQAGRVRGFASPTWAEVYAETGRHGLGKGDVDVRRCYSESWRSPLADGPPRHYVHLWVEPTRWVRAFQDTMAVAPDETPLRTYTWDPDVSEETQLSLVACQAMSSLLQLLWGEPRSRGGGLFHPDDGVGVRVITNSPELERIARDHARNAVEHYMAGWLAGCPVVLTVDPHDCMWPKNK